MIALGQNPRWNMENHELNCKYKLDNMPENTWRDARTLDGERFPWNSAWRWDYTCINSLCGSSQYGEAVKDYNQFIGDLASSMRGVGHSPWWFRGQANMNWTVLPSAMRPNFIQSVYLQLPVTFNGNAYTPRQLFMERLIMSSFVREGSGLLPSGLSKEDWYVRAQHHGLPTRLLDWTLNPQIALWMALDATNENDSDGVIIAMIPKAYDDKREIINYWNNERVLRFFSWMASPTNFSMDDEELDELCACEAILTYAPNNVSARQLNQQSRFTLHLPAAKDSTNVANVGLNDFYECREFVVKASLKPYYRNFLYVSGIRRWNIYPDLDNLARGLREEQIVTPGRSPVYENMRLYN